MMRKTLTLFFLLMLGIFLPFFRAAAQTPAELPLFSMTLVSGQSFKATDIPKGKPVLLIYFAPDCDHCHTLMNDFFKRVNDFKEAEVIMVTFKPVSEVASFAQAYQTFRFPNIRVGTEGTTYFLRYFYKLQNTPFTALYNRDGKLVSSYRNTTPLNEVARQLKKLINTTS